MTALDFGDDRTPQDAASGLQIRSVSGKLLFTSQHSNVRSAVAEAISRGANLYGASLYGADLRGANLYGADLYAANLRGANLPMNVYEL